MTKKIEYAFPNKIERDTTYSFKTPGMTLRDYFAGQALIGFLSNPNIDSYPHETAALAYTHADAMLKERNE